MRILLVSPMYPGPADPDFGAFVKQVADELERQGHDLERAVIDRRGGSRAKYARFTADAVNAARRFRPDVVYAHFLVPGGSAGALAALAGRAALVVTAHGRDVRNIGSIPGVAALTRATVARANAVIAVSDYLRRKLVAEIPKLSGRVEVIDCGVDLERFHGSDPEDARRRVDWSGDGPRFLCVGTLDERKNVVRLADAFARLQEGTLVFVGDGPLRGQLEGRERVSVVGRVPHERVAAWIAACDVLCQPSLVEPFGQALLEAMASERPVVATRIGGPPEFVTAECGVLVDPEDVGSIKEGLRQAADLPSPNAAARKVAAEHDVRRQAARIAEVLAGSRAQ
jgi:glycosyltransferase involved in cell wall biosynthesis